LGESFYHTAKVHIQGASVSILTESLAPRIWDKLKGGENYSWAKARIKKGIPKVREFPKWGLLLFSVLIWDFKMYHGIRCMMGQPILQGWWYRDSIIIESRTVSSHLGWSCWPNPFHQGLIFCCLSNYMTFCLDYSSDIGLYFSYFSPSAI
jgi:hypothetical protein